MCRFEHRRALDFKIIQLISLAWTLLFIILSSPSFLFVLQSTAYGLSLEVDTDNAKLVETTTLSIVVFTTIVFGGLTYPLLRLLGIGDKDSEVPHSPEQNDANATQNQNATRQNVSKMWFSRYKKDDNSFFIDIQDRSLSSIEYPFFSIILFFDFSYFAQTTFDFHWP